MHTCITCALNYQALETVGIHGNRTYLSVINLSVFLGLGKVGCYFHKYRSLEFTLPKSVKVRKLASIFHNDSLPRDIIDTNTSFYYHCENAYFEVFDFQIISLYKSFSRGKIFPLSYAREMVLHYKLCLSSKGNA